MLGDPVRGTITGAWVAPVRTRLFGRLLDLITACPGLAQAGFAAASLGKVVVGALTL